MLKLIPNPFYCQQEKEKSVPPSKWTILIGKKIKKEQADDQEFFQ